MTSTIKVNTVKDTASTDIIKKCGTSITVGTASDTTTVAGNAVRSNALQASDGANIVSQVGSTITLGATGDNIVLAGGATQSGFGREGSVDWQTGSIKTGTFTAANGEGYFVDTSGSTSTANLPAGSAGAIVAFSDYARNFSTNKLTISPNGSEKIGGIAQNLDLDINGQALTLVYVDGTKGWINVQNAEDTETGTPPFICASVSGSCNTLVNAPCGNFKIATFKGPGSFTVSSISGCATNNKLDYIISAGGGSGARDNGGGGGGGGVRFATETSTMSPPAPAYPKTGGSSVVASVQAYTIAVGGGGPYNAPPDAGTRGTPSTALGLTATGGGGGGPDGGSSPEKNGGSGGGSGQASTDVGSGNDPSVSPPQGQPGGTSPSSPGGGGGGGGFIVTGSSTPGQNDGGAGGAGGGFPVELIGTAAGVPCGSFRYLSGGGGGGVGQPGSGGGGPPGLGGGAAGGPNGNPAPAAGVINTGGGGGGGGQGGAGTSGGSGIVVIRYRFQ